jgi:hypothetical protein
MPAASAVATISLTCSTPSDRCASSVHSSSVRSHTVDPLLAATNAACGTRSPNQVIDADVRPEHSATVMPWERRRSSSSSAPGFQSPAVFSVPSTSSMASR